MILCGCRECNRYESAARACRKRVLAGQNTWENGGFMPAWERSDMNLARALRPGLGHQAIDTAINASNNINTPPTMGSTMGIKGTTASTASTSWSGVWGAGADMVILSMVRPEFLAILTTRSPARRAWGFIPSFASVLPACYKKIDRTCQPACTTTRQYPHWTN